MSNERAQEWLRRCGFDLEPEPEWVTGRKPDFFCQGLYDLWVEVKSLAPAEYMREMAGAVEDLRRRGIRLRGFGWTHALVGPGYHQRDGKHAIRLAEDFVPDTVPENELYVVAIPTDPILSETLTTQYVARDGSIVRYLSLMSETQAYSHYPSLEPRDWTEEVRIDYSQGRSETAHLFRFFTQHANSPLRVAFGASSEPRSIRSFGSGVHRNGAVRRLRDVVSDAADQIRNGCSFRAAPGLVMVYHDDLDWTGDDGVLSAAFGDLQYPVDLRTVALGDPVLSGNGVLGPNKNRSASAISYLHGGEEVVTVINPWASNPVPPNQLLGKKYIVNSEGKVLAT